LTSDHDDRLMAQLDADFAASQGLSLTDPLTAEKG
jgi:hypothetical protein